MSELSNRQTFFLKGIAAKPGYNPRRHTAQDKRTAGSLIKRNLLDEQWQITEPGKAALERARQAYLAIRWDQVTLNVLTAEDIKHVVGYAAHVPIEKVTRIVAAGPGVPIVATSFQARRRRGKGLAG